VELPLDDYVCLVNDPRESSPFGRTFTVEYLGNVVDGEIVKYLNVEMDVMKDVAMRTIMDGSPVWFGCDVGKMMRRDMGIWDAGLYDYESVYGTSFDLPKADRLRYHQTLMTHAMLFTGVDQGLLHDERLVVRAAHVRNRRTPQRPAAAASGGGRPGADHPAAVGPDGIAGKIGTVTLFPPQLAMTTGPGARK
jgi:hypothetical protein